VPDMDRQPECYSIDDLFVDVERRRVTRDGREIPLGQLTFDLLITLVHAAPELVSVDTLMKTVWPTSVIGPETVSHRVTTLRDALGDDPKTARYIAVVRGRGYRVVPTVNPCLRAEPSTGPARLRAALRWK
jgi:DNA-binding winged helix-turn-helix (wHTH) protein